MKILRRILLVVTILYWMLILTLTHWPRPPHFGPQISDRLQHFLGFGVLTSLLYMSFWASWPTKRWTAMYTVLIVLSYGVLDEWTQPLFGRSLELTHRVGDWLADMAGAGVAMGVLVGVRWMIRRGMMQQRSMRTQVAVRD